MFETLIKETLELLNRKAKDYGGSYDKLRREFGSVAFYIRLYDKLYRLRQIDEHGHQVSETAEDTLKDMLGYVLLEMRYRRYLKGETDEVDHS